MDIARSLAWTAARYPDRVGLVAPAQQLTYRAWNARVNHIAHALLSVGVRPGDRVGMFLTNSEVLASTHLATQKISAMSTPYNIRLSPSELSYCLEDSRPRVALVDDLAADVAYPALAGMQPRPVVLHAGTGGEVGTIPFEEMVAQQSDTEPDVAVDDSAYSVMLYTSGTTGRPKGVPRTQRAEWAASVAHIMQHRYAPGESTLGAMPMYHTMGLRSLLSMVVIGGTFVELDTFDAARAIERIVDHQITSLYLVPTAFWALHQTGDLDSARASVRRLGYAGASMTSTLSRSLSETLDPETFVNHYGSSEIYTYAFEDQAADKPGSAGRPGVFSRLRLVSLSDTSSSRDVAPGETGEIIASLQSEEAFSGYWQRPDADEASIRDGWYHTGDLGTLDDRGDLWVAGRVDDMIITGGENVHPVEVEDVLARCHDVAEVAVVGLTDEKWGQAVTAFVVPLDPTDQETGERIEQWLRTEAGLSPYKRPKQVVVVKELPKNPVGKLLRRKLVTGEYEPVSRDGG